MVFIRPFAGAPARPKLTHALLGTSILAGRIVARLMGARVGAPGPDARPEAFYDDRFVKELDNQGFYKQLWK